MNRLHTRLKRLSATNLSPRDLFSLMFLLCLIALLSLASTRDKANTVDEMVHVLSGHAAWSEKDYRLNPENGTIPSRIAALPLEFMSPGLNLETDTLAWAESDQWHLGHALWFNSPIDHRKILLWSHVSMLLFNLIGIALIFIWSFSLWGRGGAYLSLLLAGFSPNFLGHMPLATSDFAGAWTLVLATLVYAGLLEKVTPQRVLAAGFTAALALLCKHTGILLAPVGILLLAWRYLDGKSVSLKVWRKEIRLESGFHKLAAMGGGSLAAILVCTCLVWLAYGFRYGAVNPEAGTFTAFQVDWVLLAPTPVDPFIQLMRKWHLLPEAFLYGLNFILSSSSRGSFLNGTFSPEGFFAYHFWTYLYKTPLPAMVLHLLGIAGVVAFIRKRRLCELPHPLRGLLILGIVYGGLLLGSDISIGHRHAFPILYLTCILSGICGAAKFWKIRWITPAAYLLGLSLVPLSAMHIDRTVSYMNVIGGGAKHGYRRLINSSLDWGQDLPSAIKAIQSYQDIHPDRPVYLSYFGTADPGAYGLKNVNMLYAWGIWSILERPDYLPRLESGLYVISASEMDSMPADWSLKLEIRYQTLSQLSRGIYDKLEKEKTLASMEANAILSREEMKILQDYELFRVQRLKMYLTQREPDDVLHGSILLFEISREEILEFSGEPNSNEKS